MGNVRVSTKNLEIIQVDTNKDLLLIKGAIPGAPGGDVMVRPVNPNEVNMPTNSEEVEVVDESQVSAEE